jgi:hypothetical protein
MPLDMPLDEMGELFELTVVEHSLSELDVAVEGPTVETDFRFLANGFAKLFELFELHPCAIHQSKDSSELDSREGRYLAEGVVGKFLAILV